MRRTNSRRFLYWLPAICWMALVFFMSTRAGGSDQSGSLLSGLFGLSGYWLDVANGILRKCAHVTEYAILSALCYWALRRAHGLTRRGAVAGGILLAMVYACSDEIHQLFVPGREGRVQDWLMDTTGALIGTLLQYRRGQQRNEEVTNA